MTADNPSFDTILAQAQERQEAINYLRQLQRDAQAHKREHGNPRNPRAALIGHENDFQEAAQAAYHLRIILNEIEKTSARERRGAVVNKAIRTADRALDVFIGVGLTTLAALGIAAAFILLRLPEPIVQVAAIIGVGVALARVVITARK